MRRLLACALFFCGGHATAQDVAPTSLPIEGGLPVHVRVAARYLDVRAVHESDGTFDATIDLRVGWLDARSSYPAADAPSGYLEYRGDDAGEWLSAHWSPHVEIANAAETIEDPRIGVRVFPDGTVELMERASGTFHTALDVEQFPFDRQQLPLDLVSEDEDDDRVALDFQQPDLDFSRYTGGDRIDGWEPSLVDAQRASVLGWYGASHSQVTYALRIERDARKTIPSIFIPIFASLLIPMIALWLNKVEDGGFKVEAFELTNIVIGGLFAVIALNFTVFSEYPLLATSDNLVARLFGLNYLVLAASLGVNLVFFRLGLFRRWFGAHVQEQLFRYLTWSVPAVSFATAAVIVISAML